MFRNIKVSDEDELEKQVIEETMKNTLMNKVIGHNHDDSDSDSEMST
jgi:hypothetical protein